MPRGSCNVCKRCNVSSDPATASTPRSVSIFTSAARSSYQNVQNVCPTRDGPVASLAKRCLARCLFRCPQRNGRNGRRGRGSSRPHLSPRTPRLGNAAEHPLLTGRSQDGTRGLSKLIPRPVRSMRQISASQTAEEDPLAGPCAIQRARRSLQSPSASLRSASGPAAAKPVFLKSVLENLPERAADMRLFSRDAGGSTHRHPPTAVQCNLLKPVGFCWDLPTEA